MGDTTMAMPARSTGVFAMLAQNRAMLVPSGALVLLVLAVVLGPFLFDLPDPERQTLAEARLAPLSPGHLLGTDGLGRDVLSRALDGGRVSLLVGFSAVAIGFIVGGLLGVTAGFLGGKVDAVISRLTEIFSAFPSLILALAIATFLGPSVRNIVLAICCHTVPAYVRLARANAIKIRNSDFVVAASLAGANVRYTLRRHIVPLVLQSLLAYGLLATGTAIVIESSLSFLGLGVRPPQSTWGNMLADGKTELGMASHVAFVPAILLFLTVLNLNLVGEGLRTRADRKVGAA
ncbi:ABC transporter permease [Microtetraspora glauca]|uniref:ABC transporter permease n=1 Tax=Microtetraspora glauca TaxID=1996 RepID=A0ABV3GRU9_MICGL